MRRAVRFWARTRARQLRPRGRPGRLGNPFAHELLTTAEASEFTRIPMATLKDWRQPGRRRGPPYIKVHAHLVLYRGRDLEDFLEARTVDPAAEGRGEGA